MKIKFPEIVREIDLAEYAPELHEKMQVWVNPPSSLLQEYNAALDVYLKSKGDEGLDGVIKYIASLLSKGSEKWTAKDIRELVDNTSETDPAFWGWLLARIIEVIASHRSVRKKVLEPPQLPLQAAAGQTTSS